MVTQNHVAFVIVGAGTSVRFGGDIPKQFLPFCQHKTLCDYVITKAQHLGFHHIYVVVPNIYQNYWNPPENIHLIIGGDSRDESVYHAVDYIKNHTTHSYVMVHDCARPFITMPMITQLLQHCIGECAIAPALHIYDALKYKTTLKPAQREQFLTTQTPQCFSIDLLYNAHVQHKKQQEIIADDDISLIEHYTSLHSIMIEGDKRNQKITTQQDLALMTNICQPQKIFFNASGFDVHQFTQGNHLMLGGVKIPAEYSLLGHSDADVILHALCDALLGLCADGDIGTHFCNSDPQWQGASSSIFVEYCYKKCQYHQVTLTHIDITFLGETPKLSPYRTAIIEHIASLLQLPLSSISLKATTTEKMGFLGRGEGLACQVLASAYKWES